MELDEPENVMLVEILDGPTIIKGFARFEALGGGQTRLTIGGDLPGLGESVAEQLGPMIEHSAATIKSLVEAEM